MTINDLFRSLSDLRPAENEILLFELYKVYRKITNSKESFDEFYFWGDMLLNDFDDTDKYLADASKLFQNVSDLKKIDQQFGGLSEEQIEIVQRFWTNFNPDKKTDAKEKFISIWSVLGPLYTEFRKVMKEKNLAYEGMIFRDVAANPEFVKSPALKWGTVHFAGFNALNECEKILMVKLKEAGRAKFYWDYDASYISEGGLNSAGFFLKNNLKLFGNDMPDDWCYETFLSTNGGGVKRRIIETSSDIAQVKLIPELLSDIPGITPENAHHTAVILADENLLLPALTSLPENMQDINITMGYPLKQTSAYSLVKQLLDLQRNAKIRDGVLLFSHVDVTRLLKNDLIAGLMDEADMKIPEEIVRNNLILVPDNRFRDSKNLSQIFVKSTSPSAISDYLKNILLLIVSEKPEKLSSANMPGSVVNEFIYRIILAINRLETITRSPDIELTIDTWTRLLDRILRMQSVPFSGEPLSGIQIMGILETRTLDFKNLVMLSVNEGIMPAVTASSSFIPFSLRQAFGLPSLNHQESIYAYHFYRLLHRAEDVTFIFNSNPEGLRSGEMSRFLQQMKYQPSGGPETMNLSFGIRNPVTISDRIERTPEHIRRLQERFPAGTPGKPFSPSAINTWLNCRMKFYYQFVNGLSEPKEVITEIDPALLGSMVHAATKSLYSGFIGKTLDSGTIRSFIEDRQGLEELIRRSMNEIMRRENESFPAINEMMVGEVLYNYVSRILEIDRLSAPFTIMSIEKQYSFPLVFDTGSGSTEIIAGGKIDRVDVKEGVTRIVDYKTGKTVDSVVSLADLFKDDRDKEPDAWLQTLFYCEAYLAEVPGARTRPSVYKIKKTPGEDVIDKLVLGGTVIEDYLTIRQEFIYYLGQVIRNIFSSSEPYTMTKMKGKKCNYCAFRVLCGR
jgi:CRISPR/Cas system-associated exonuclease Cas4 (RecB family)